MKRRLPEEEENDEADRLFAGSPVRKQARPDVPQAWNVAASVSDMQARCQRILDGSSNADDVSEVGRLATGGIIGAPSAPWAAERDLPPGPCGPLGNAYYYLWHKLAANDHEAALGAVRSAAQAWPPTFKDVVRAYAAIDPSLADRCTRIIKEHTTDRPIAEVASELVAGLDAVVRRHQKLDTCYTGPPSPRDASPFAVGDWAPLLDPQSAIWIGGCDPNISYFVLELVEDSQNVAVLLAIYPAYNEAKVVDTAVVPHGEPPTKAAQFAPGGYLYERDYGRRVMSDALRPYMASLVPFLASLAASESCCSHDSKGSNAEVALFDPMPAGAQQIKAALVPFCSSFALPTAVRDYVNTAYVRASHHLDEIRGVPVDECNLVLALRLFGAQLYARSAHLQYPPRTLFDFAARAYRGPLRRGMVPDEVIDRAGVYAWQGTCGAPALPSGRLPDADRLLDVATVWGIEPNAAETARPELLCEQLHRLVLERDSVMPM